MKKLSYILSVYFCFISTSFAVLGPPILDSERPHSICAIEFYSKDSGELDEVCSAVVINEKSLLTAAHCSDKILERPHQVLCRNNIEAKVSKTTLNPKVDLLKLKYHEEEHRFDTALLELDRPLSVPHLKVSHTKKMTLELIESSPKCGIFGHGGFRDAMRKSGISTNAEIFPSQIVFEGDLIRIMGAGDRNSGLVEPGDSGGSLSCQNKAGDWFHIAQVSGRTMNSESLFAPAYLFDHDSLSEQRDLSQASRVLQEKWIAEDLGKELAVCAKSHKIFLKKDYKGSDKSTCQKALIEHARNLSPVTLKVKIYSLIELNLTQSMIQLSSNRSPDRLLRGKNPFSTVDHFYNHFDITHMDENFAYGDLTLYGYSESYLCLFNILCDQGLYKNIKVRIEDLVFPER